MTAWPSERPRGAVSAVGDAPAGRGSITRAAAGIAVYAGAFGVAFGAVAAAAGLSVLQAVVLSVVMFSGASQFALVGILGVGGAPLAAIAAALLLGLRNAFYGVPISGIVRPRGVVGSSPPTSSSTKPPRWQLPNASTTLVVMPSGPPDSASALCGTSGRSAAQ